MSIFDKIPKNYYIITILLLALINVAIVIAAYKHPLSFYLESTQFSNLTEVDVWTTLDRKTALVDKTTQKPLIVLSEEASKNIMVSQLKLYKIQELESLNLNLSTLKSK